MAYMVAAFGTLLLASMSWTARAVTPTFTAKSETRGYRPASRKRRMSAPNVAMDEDHTLADRR